ncbi:NADH-quinone oxidoreductase subunit J family protein [Thermovibrio sp.]
MREFFLYLFGFLCVAFAFRAVLERSVIRGGVSLLASFVSLGAVYFTVGSEFIGIVQVIVYGGAIIVLYLFALMTMDLKKMRSEPLRLGFVSAGGFLSGALFFLIVIGLSKLSFKLPLLVSGAKELASPLFFKFLLPFEVVSILLLVATIGAVSVGRREE